MKRMTSMAFVLLSACGREPAEKASAVTPQIVAPPGPQALPASDVLKQHAAVVDGMPVSITWLQDDVFLIANYKKLFLFTPSGPVWSAVRSDASAAPQFAPTDTAYDASTHRLFIANYTGNDILVGKLDLANLTFTMERRLGDERTKSPEGIVIFDDKVAVANYDGNSIQIFNQSAKFGDKAHCNIVKRRAHGIAYEDGYLFASGLREREILKIDPVTCAVVARAGEAGWKDGEYLWPTSIASDGEGRIVISDAHTGMLTRLSAKDLSFVDRWGSNGPGKLAFNMPYGVEVQGGHIWASSTFDRDVIAFSGPDWSKAEVYSQTSGWSWSRGSFPQASMLHEQEYAGLEHYTNPVSVEIAGRCYHPAYTRLEACDPKGDGFDTMPAPGYFVQTSPYRDGVLVTSPQSEKAYYFAKGATQFSEVFVGPDAWVVEGKLIGPAGEIFPAAAEQLPAGQ